MKRILPILFAGLLVLGLTPVRADLIKQSTSYNRLVYMQDSTASRSPGVSGLTLAVSQAKNGAVAFSVITPTVTDLGGGWYVLALTAAHNDTLGARALKVTATGADETDAVDQIIAVDPNDPNLALARLDAAVTSRMATFALPTNFSSLAITGGGAVTAGTVSDKTGYSLTQAFPTNFSSLAITVGGAVTAGTVSDKTGYSLTQGFPANFASMLIDGTDHGVTVHTVLDKTGYTLANSQTFTTTGAVGSVTGNVTVGAYAAGFDPATLVLDATASSHNTAGTVGNKINSAASATDPWSTSLPGSYIAGQAGYIIGNRLDAAVSTRSTYAGGDTSGTTTLLARIPGTVQPQTGDAFARLGAPAGASIAADIAALPGAVWQVGTRTLTGNVTVGGYASGQDPATLVNAPTASANAAAVWAAVSRTLTGTQALSANDESVLSRLLAMTNSTPAFTVAALANAPAGGGGGGGSSAPYMVYIDGTKPAKATLTFQQGDSGVVVQETLRYPDGTPIDLTGKTVKFRLVSVSGGSPVVDQDASVVFAVGGVASYALTSADTATTGTYYRRWQITDGTGHVTTYPNTTSLSVVIHP